jgi:hypothetical protein
VRICLRSSYATNLEQPFSFQDLILKSIAAIVNHCKFLKLFLPKPFLRNMAFQDELAGK